MVKRGVGTPGFILRLPLLCFIFETFRDKSTLKSDCPGISEGYAPSDRFSRPASASVAGCFAPIGGRPRSPYTRLSFSPCLRPTST